MTVTAPPEAQPGEQTRARYPDEEGYVQRDGRRLFYEVYGEGKETAFLLPTWSLVHSRHWKMQIPYLARHFRVLAMDGLGNGRSDRCRNPRCYGPEEFAREPPGHPAGLGGGAGLPRRDRAQAAPPEAGPSDRLARPGPGHARAGG
jgi:hypothetical protein